MELMTVRTLGELILPPFGSFLLLLAAYLLAGRHPRAGRGLAILACASLLLLSMTGLSDSLRSWPSTNVRTSPPYPPAQAIVVLGGGRYLSAPEYGHDTANASTLQRVRYAAHLYRQIQLPIMVSGGRPQDQGTRSEAAIMRSILQDEFGVPVRWTEDQSRDTRENADNSAALLHSNGISRVYLITNSNHMRRAAAYFQADGIDVVPMPTIFRKPDPNDLAHWLPSFQGLSKSRAWLYEMLAGYSGR